MEVPGLCQRSPGNRKRFLNVCTWLYEGPFKRSHLETL